MALTPDDIVNYPLKQSMRGYSVSQVDELLDQVADELERLYRELEDTRRRLDRAESRAESVSETETTLKRTLVTAQRAAEQTLEEARSRAADIVADAEEEADRVRSAATQDLRGEVTELTVQRDRLEERVEALRRFEDDYRTRLHDLLDRHQRLLDEETSVEPEGLPAGDEEDELPEELESSDWEDVWPDESWAGADVWQALASDEDIDVDVLDALRRSAAEDELHPEGEYVEVGQDVEDVQDAEDAEVSAEPAAAEVHDPGSGHLADVDEQEHGGRAGGDEPHEDLSRADDEFVEETDVRGSEPGSETDSEPDEASDEASVDEQTAGVDTQDRDREEEGDGRGHVLFEGGSRRRRRR